MTLSGSDEELGVSPDEGNIQEIMTAGAQRAQQREKNQFGVDYFSVVNLMKKLPLSQHQAKTMNMNTLLINHLPPGIQHLSS